MSEEQRQKEAEVVQEFKLEQDNELRFEVESKEKVTLEVWYITQFFPVSHILFVALQNAA